MSTSDGSRDDYLPSRVHRLSSHRSTDSSNSCLTLPPLLSHGPHGRQLAGCPTTRNGKGKSYSQPTTQHEIDGMRLPPPVPSYGRFGGPDGLYVQPSDSYGSPGASTRESSVGYPDSDVKLGSSPPSRKRSYPGTIVEDPLVESPAADVLEVEGTDDTVMADEAEGKSTGKHDSVFVTTKCQSSATPDSQRSTLDDFKAVFGDKAVGEVPAQTPAG